MSDDPTIDDGASAGFDRLARRTVDAVLGFVRRGMALAGGVLIVAAVCCIGGFLLGLAALSDGIESVWIVLGGGFMVIGVGAVLIAMWRLRAVRRGAESLVGEVRRWIAGDDQAEQVVIETIETSEGAGAESAVVLSRQFAGMRRSVVSASGTYEQMTAALRAIAGFPLLLALSAFVSVVFTGLGLLFLIALAI